VAAFDAQRLPRCAKAQRVCDEHVRSRIEPEGAKVERHPEHPELGAIEFDRGAA
jgi:hypothetical protein